MLRRAARCGVLRASVLAFGIQLSLLSGLGLFSGVARAGIPLNYLLPDMFPFVDENAPSSMETLQTWSLSGSTLSYRSMFANQGDGYFEIRRGNNIDSARDEMEQWVYPNSDGTGTPLKLSIGSLPVIGSPGNPAPGVPVPYDTQTSLMWFEDFTKFSLLEAPVVNDLLTVGAEVAGTTKASWRLSNNRGPLPGYSTSATNGDQLTHQRIAVGWADMYTGGPGQSFDISAVAPGPLYWLRQTVDPTNRIQETDETNNSFEILIDLNKPGEAILVAGQFVQPGDPVPIAPGDLNEDGMINLADWLAFQARADVDLAGLTPEQALLQGDMDLNGQHGLPDYVLFRDFFEQAQGAGSFAALQTAVPEPGSLACLACLAVSLLATGRRWLRPTVLLLVGICIAVGGPVADRAQAGPIVKKSLLFGIDGLGFGTQGFSVTSTPFMDSLIDGSWQASYNGAYSDQAFAGGVLGTPTEQPTVSGPGWSTMLTGVWTDRHKVLNNSSGSSPGDFAVGDFANNPPYLATLKEADPTLSTASYVYWGPIEDYIIGSIDNDGDLTNDVDFHFAYHNDVNAVNAAVADISDVGGLDPDAVFISVDLVDGAGHSCGSSGACYATAVQTADSFVGQALTAIANRPNFANEDWQIVITADHGHRVGGGHGGQSDLERTIPFIVASKNLAQGNLPISFPQEVSHADTAPTILDHFGVSIPSHYYGVSRAAGQLVGDPDINGDGFVQGDGTGSYEDDDVVAFISLWLQPNTAENPNPADFNFDGITDLSDWIFLNGFDPAMGQAILSALSVPEPTSLTLTLALVGLLSVRCGRRR
jgi:hypothetical protein